MYALDDPRRTLTTEVQPHLDPPGAAEFLVLSDIAPLSEAPGTLSW